jgi:hypothetical protein
LYSECSIWCVVCVENAVHIYMVYSVNCMT